MNNHQIRHIAQVIHLTAFAQFGVFGYAGLTPQPVDWLSVNLSGAVFLVAQGAAVLLLGLIREEGL